MDLRDSRQRGLEPLDTKSGWKPLMISLTYAVFEDHAGIWLRQLDSVERPLFLLHIYSRSRAARSVVTFDDDPPSLLAIAHGSQCFFYDIRTSSCIDTISSHGRAITAIAFSSHRNTALLVGTVDGCIRLLNRKSEAWVEDYCRNLPQPCHLLALEDRDNSSPWIAAASGGTVYLFLSRDTAPIVLLGQDRDHVKSLQWRRNGDSALVVGFESGVVHLLTMDAIMVQRLRAAAESATGTPNFRGQIVSVPVFVDGLPTQHHSDVPISQIILVDNNGLLILSRAKSHVVFLEFDLSNSSFVELWCIRIETNACAFVLDGHSIPAQLLVQHDNEDDVQSYRLSTVASKRFRSQNGDTLVEMAHKSPRSDPAAKAMLPYSIDQWLKDQRPANSRKTRDQIRTDAELHKPPRRRTIKGKDSSPKAPREQMLDANTARHSSLRLRSPSPSEPELLSASEIMTTDSVTNLASLSGEALDPGLAQDSDSDDDNFAGPLANSGTLLPGGANVPLPRTCGAVFSPNGRLTVFLIAKAEPRPKPEVRYDIITTSTPSEIHALFPCFGNLQIDLKDAHEQLNHRDTVRIRKPAAEDIPGVSLESWSSWQKKMSPLQTVFANPLAQSKLTVSIHSVDSFVPQRGILAEEYHTFCKVESNLSQLCEHNAALALETGLLPSADAWRTLQMALAMQTMEVSKDITYPSHAAHRLFGEGNTQGNSTGSNATSRFSTCVSAARASEIEWTIRSLLAWAEKNADIQLLACMSAVLVGSAVIAEREWIQRQARSVTINMPLNVVATNDDAVGTPPAVAMLRANSQQFEYFTDSPRKSFASQSSSRNPSLPTTPYNDPSILTPPLHLTANKPRQGSRNSQTSSASPETSRSSFSAAARYYAQSITDKIASYGSSPPTKKSSVSPNNEISTSLTSTGSWGKTVSFATNMKDKKRGVRRSNSNAIQEDDLVNYDSDRTIDDADSPITPKQSNFSVSVVWNTNNNFFDDEYPVPADDATSTTHVISSSTYQSLMPRDILLISALWQQAYANWLRAQNLDLTATEFDKIAASAIAMYSRGNDPISPNNFFQQPNEYLSPITSIIPTSRPSISESTTPDMQDVALTTTTSNKLTSPPTTPAALTKAVVPPTCGICSCAVFAAQQVCVKCLHVTHPWCLDELVGALDGVAGFECPVGCGCDCSAA